MKQNRRDFLKTSGLIAGAGALGSGYYDLFANTSSVSMKNTKLQLSFRPYTLELRHQFTIASSSRSTTPVMLTQVAYGDLIGYGEASMPPYLGESHETATAFLSKVDLSPFQNPFDLETILDYVFAIAPGNFAAKASVDIALHDLVGKMLGRPWYDIWGFNKENTPYTSYTIGIDKPDVVREKTREASQFKVLKVKLGRETDREMIETIRSVTDTPLCVDVNQGWKDKQAALDEIHWLKEQGVVFIEQPMSKTDPDANAWLTQHSPLPIIADEALQGVDDVLKAKGVYSGINIKLMKCGGMREGHKMLTLARSLGMKIMVGCMTETSCAISAAAHLTPLAQWADLDGALLISNDIYEGTKIIDGKIVIADLPGIGIKPL
ncbi:muconate cycloisomerase [uncultured bacterium]|nr:muconate cycloisomerase [uncultured bacterium]